MTSSKDWYEAVDRNKDEAKRCREAGDAKGAQYYQERADKYENYALDAWERETSGPPEFQNAWEAAQAARMLEKTYVDPFKGRFKP